MVCMNRKRTRITAIIIIIVLLFAAFLGIRYYQKYYIYKNIDLLKSGDEKTRSKAVENLVKLGEPSVKPLLFALNYDPTYVKGGAAGLLSVIIRKKQVQGMADNLSGESRNLKMGAIEALGKIRDTRAIPPLVQILVKERDYRDYTSDALGNIGAPSVPHLLRYINHKDDGVKFSVIMTLGKTHSKEAVMPLIWLFMEDDENICALSSRALTELGEPAVAPLGELLFSKNIHTILKHKILRILRNIKDPNAVELILQSSDRVKSEVWQQAREELIKVDYPEAIPVLLEGLRQKRRDISYASFLTLNRSDANIEYPLIELLNNENPKTREYAIYLLFKYAHPNAADPIIKRLKDNSPDVRFAAARYLGRLGIFRAVIPLAEAINSGNTMANNEILENLKILNDKRCVEILVNKYGTSDRIMKILIIMTLGSLKDDRVMNLLIRELKNSEPGIKRTAVGALGDLGDRRACAALLECMVNPEVKEDCIKSIGKIGDSRTADKLIEMLEDPSFNKDSSISGEVVIALGRIGDKKATLPLLRRFRSLDSCLKDDIFYSLGHLKDERAAAPLLKMLQDDRFSDSRGNIIDAIGDIGDKRTIEPLIKLRSQPGTWHREEILTALGKMKDPKAYEFLMGVKRSRKTKDTEVLISSLGNYETPEVLDILRENLKNSDDLVESAALNALGRMKSEKSTLLLIEALKNKDENTRLHIIELLGNKKDPLAVPALVEELGKSNLLFRYCIINALLKIGEPARVYMSTVNSKGNEQLEKALKLTMIEFSDPDYPRKAELGTEKWIELYRELETGGQ